MGRRTVLKKSVIGIRIFSYSVFTFVMIAGLTLAVNTIQLLYCHQ